VSEKELEEIAWLGAFLYVQAYPGKRGLLRGCAEDLGVSRQLFHYHYTQWRKTGVIHTTRMGPAPKLGVELEEALVMWIRDMIAAYTSPTPDWVKKKAKDLAKANGIDPATVGRQLV
jgi:hypothetical protein